MAESHQVDVDIDYVQSAISREVRAHDASLDAFVRSKQQVDELTAQWIGIGAQSFDSRWTEVSDQVESVLKSWHSRNEAANLAITNYTSQESDNTSSLGGSIELNL